MTPYLRLRQVCLVTSDLARETDRIKAVLGLEECYRDANVAKYGLENVLFPVGSNFIEIVSPTRPGTAAGRFLDRHGGGHGYMVIMDCDDPVRRQRHVESLGVRIANVIRHGDYLGVQLHPKDTGAAMIEFNHTAGGEDPAGPYAPAGSDWQAAVRQDVTQRLLAAEIECPDPRRFSARWGEILGRPVKRHSAETFRITLDSGAINFLPADSAQAVLAGIELEVANCAAIVAAAQAHGCAAGDRTVNVCGVRFRLTEAV
ncbi:MAG: VOC family protein [Betaproteobacteria bacterium]|nr:VOC family protein [Betaproteobacteria bacterium]